MGLWFIIDHVNFLKANGTSVIILGCWRYIFNVVEKDGGH